MNDKQELTTIGDDDLALVTGGAGWKSRAATWARRGVKFAGRRLAGPVGVIYDIMEPTPAY